MDLWEKLLAFSLEVQANTIKISIIVIKKYSLPTRQVYLELSYRMG